jgi:hypothetical protein
MDLGVARRKAQAEYPMPERPPLPRPGHLAGFDEQGLIHQLDQLTDKSEAGFSLCIMQGFFIKQP